MRFLTFYTNYLAAKIAGIEREIQPTPEEAYYLGEDAYEHRQRLSDNPFPKNSDQFNSWNDGFTTKRMYAQMGMAAYHEEGED